VKGKQSAITLLSFLHNDASGLSVQQDFLYQDKKKDCYFTCFLKAGQRACLIAAFLLLFRPTTYILMQAKSKVIKISDIYHF
jgi:hypothetical protein